MKSGREEPIQRALGHRGERLRGTGGRPQEELQVEGKDGVADWLWGRGEETLVNGGAMPHNREKGWARSSVAGRLHSGCPTAIHAELSCKQVAICTWNSGESGPGW